MHFINIATVVPYLYTILVASLKLVRWWAWKKAFFCIFIYTEKKPHLFWQKMTALHDPHHINARRAWDYYPTVQCAKKPLFICPDSYQCLFIHNNHATSILSSFLITKDSWRNTKCNSSSPILFYKQRFMEQWSIYRVKNPSPQIRILVRPLLIKRMSVFS